MSVTSGTNSGSRPKRQITSGVFTASGINSIRIQNFSEAPDAFCGWGFFLSQKQDFSWSVPGLSSKKSEELSVIVFSSALYGNPGMRYSRHDLWLCRLAKRKASYFPAERICKNRQKMAGGFRTAEGRGMYCRIMSVIGTVKRRGLNIFQSIADILTDTPVII